MQEQFEITMEEYMHILESVGDRSENRVCARFLYIEKDRACEGWHINVDPTHIFETIANLKVSFKECDDVTKIYLSLSRQAGLDDRNSLLYTADDRTLKLNRPATNMEAWVVIKNPWPQTH